MVWYISFKRAIPAELSSKFLLAKKKIHDRSAIVTTGHTFWVISHTSKSQTLVAWLRTMVCGMIISIHVNYSNIFWYSVLVSNEREDYKHLRDDWSWTHRELLRADFVIEKFPASAQSSAIGACFICPSPLQTPQRTWRRVQAFKHPK